MATRIFNSGCWPQTSGESPSIYRRSWALCLDPGAGISPSPGEIALYIWLFKSWKFPEPRSAFRGEHHCKKTQDLFTFTLESGRTKDRHFSSSRPGAGGHQGPPALPAHAPTWEYQQVCSSWLGSSSPGAWKWERKFSHFIKM